MLPAKKNKEAPQLVLLSVLGAGLLCIVIAFTIRLAATNEVEQIPVDQLLQQYWQEQQRQQLTESGQDKLLLQAAGSEAMQAAAAAESAAPSGQSNDASASSSSESSSQAALNQSAATKSDAAAAEQGDDEAALGKIDINSASIEQLQQLKGIGPSKAKAIVEDREQKGRFKRIEDIKRVKGIGEKLYAGIQESIVASP